MRLEDKRKLLYARAQEGALCTAEPKPSFLLRFLAIMI